VSFFVTGRWAGHADSDAFTEAMVDQLAVVAGAPVAAIPTRSARDRERQRLLDLATRRVGDHQQRLVLVVDGLDEDEGAKPGSDKPSIASLLPRRPPEAVRVLVTSRPHPGIPLDVAADHPLRQTRRRRLAPSAYAQGVEIEAKGELLEQLNGAPPQADILAFITASGGGLTLTELVELTGVPRFKLEVMLGSVFGRSLQTRPALDVPADQAEPVYLFAHVTLRAIAEEQLGGALERYRERIHQWADEFRRRGWPDDTPRYLLRPYGQLLAAARDVERLVWLAADPARHHRLLASTQGDHAALDEIAAAQRLLLDNPDPDLAAMGSLAVHRHRLASRNENIPVELPTLWAQLGDAYRAEQIARSITALDVRDKALRSIAEVMAEGRQWERAEELARTIPTLDIQAKALRGIAWAQARAGRRGEAEQLAGTIPDPTSRAQALLAITLAVASVDPDQADRLTSDAEQLASAIPDTDAQAKVRRGVASALARAGRRDEAEQLAGTISDPTIRAQALLAIARALAPTEPDRAIRLINRAEKLARTATDPETRVWALLAIARALAPTEPDRAIRLINRAEKLAQATTDSFDREWALRGIARAVAERGQWVRAEQLAGTIGNWYIQAHAFLAVARALARAGQWDRAEQLAGTIADPTIGAAAFCAVAQAVAGADPDWAVRLANKAEHFARTVSPRNEGFLDGFLEELARMFGVTDPDQLDTLEGILEAFVEGGRWDQAEDLVRTIPDPATQGEGLLEIAVALIASGERDRALRLTVDAERLAKQISDPDATVKMLLTIAEMLAGTDPDRAEQLTNDAEQVALTSRNPDTQAKALRRLVDALVEGGHWDRAEQLARTNADPVTQVSTLQTIGHALVERGHPDHAKQLISDAEEIARTITDPEAQAKAVRAIVDALFKVGLWDRAEQLAGTITDQEVQATALQRLSDALAAAGQWDRAEQLAGTITAPEAQAKAVRSLVDALAAAGQWDRAEQLAGTITDPETQAEALLGVADALVQAAKREQTDGSQVQARARRILAELLTGEKWLEAIPLVAKLDIETVVPISKTMFGVGNHRSV
jgi:tetratricopeptide (TPR) repeat protein